MLQRIQTVFLALIAICMLLVLFLPLWSGGEMSPVEMELNAWMFKNGETEITFPYTLIATLAIASVIVALIEISKYKNRMLQMKLGALNSLFMAGTLGLAAWFYKGIVEEAGVAGNFELGFWLPAIAMILNVLANRYIRKDENLVRSADRIR